MTVATPAVCVVCGSSRCHKEMLPCVWLCGGSHGYLCWSYTNHDCHVPVKHTTCHYNNKQLNDGLSLLSSALTNQIQVFYVRQCGNTSHTEGSQVQAYVKFQENLILVVIHLKLRCMHHIKYILKVFTKCIFYFCSSSCNFTSKDEHTL